MPGEEDQGNADAVTGPAVKVPYNRDTSVITPLRSVDDIIEFDKAVREVTEGLSRPIRLGSLLRLPESALVNWGIGVTAENRSHLSLLADTHYLMDADEGRGGRLDRDDLHWMKKWISAHDMDSMAEIISRLVRELAVAVDDGKRRFRIANLASGAGKLSSAIAAALQEEPSSEDILSRTEFHLIDNHDKNALAELNLRGFEAKIVLHPMMDDQFLEGGEGGFDFVVALSHLHRKPFISSYLAKVRSSLSDGGVLISGDFHSRLCHHPLHVYALLDRMGLDPARLNLFDELMGPLMGPEDGRMSRFEKGALEDHINYWTKLDYEMGSRSYRGKMKVRILGAFLSCRQLEESLIGAGFDTDIEAIRKEFPHARLPHALPLQVSERADSAAVTVALKRRPGG